MRMKWKKGDPGVTPDILWDSDVGKYVEAASYALYHEENPEMEAAVNEGIDMIIGAQQGDGYVGIYHTLVEPGKRWSSLAHNLELYGGGHILEAAVTRHIALGCPKNDKFLDAMRKYVDLIIETFGPGEGQRHDYPGHQEIELALMRLYEVTGDRRCVALTQYFIEERGRTDAPREGHAWDIAARARGDDPDFFFPYYWPRPRCYWHMQAHAPIREQKEIVGHSVQAMYWLSSVVDVALATGEQSYLDTVETLWKDMVDAKMYVTGGIGSVHIYEGFGPRYDLPNETSYAETCAAIGIMFLTQRMLKVRADAAVADVMELAVYNALLAGLSLDGKTFNYDNPIATIGCSHKRSEWFKVFCCPSNICRFLNSMGGYLYGTDTLRFTVHNYVGGEVMVGQSTWVVETEWPWHGRTSLRVKEHSEPTIVRLRVPGWAKSYEILLNGVPVEHEVVDGYASLPSLAYAPTDVINFTADMVAEHLVPHPLVHQNRGCLAVRRGPIVYALESVDHPDVPDLRLVRIDGAAALEPADMKILDKPVVGIRTRGTVIDVPPEERSSFSQEDKVARTHGEKPVELAFVPYFAWGNRGLGDMRVWIPKTSHRG
ncbi:DUF1680-domain-containing protein [Coniochaeta sp. PMI_546]|nr:DUF1680-domain-containing protein [Coniochaeta sp. PMI_546]